MKKDTDPTKKIRIQVRSPGSKCLQDSKEINLINFFLRICILLFLTVYLPLIFAFPSPFVHFFVLYTNSTKNYQFVESRKCRRLHCYTHAYISSLWLGEAALVMVFTLDGNSERVHVKRKAGLLEKTGSHL